MDHGKVSVQKSLTLANKKLAELKKANPGASFAIRFDSAARVYRVVAK